MAVFIDQLGRKVELKSKPKRIISLVPSITHLLFNLDLDDEVIGITKFCIEPKKFLSTKTIIGGTKNLKIDQILKLKPDLVIANKEENRREDILALENKVPVWVSQVRCMTDNLDFILRIGICCNRKLKAEQLIQQIHNCIIQNKSNHAHAPKPSVAYLIWKNPYMTIGGDTYINEMIEEAGYSSIFKNTLRYPIITQNDLLKANPDYIFLSSEPYPFKITDSGDFQNIKTILVNGMAFSWFGSYVINSFSYFVALNKQINASS